MKIRTIITTAAGAAAVAGGLLLATGGAASASTTATLTTASPSGHAVTIERGVADTTSVNTGVDDPTGNGPIWAHDTMQRAVTWHSAADGKSGAYDVTVTSMGSYSAFANPITGTAWKGHGPLFEQITYTDVSTTDGSQPAASHIPAVSPNTLRSQGIVAELFGDASSSNVQFGGTGHYVAIYGGIPGAPAGWYVQQG